MQKIEIRLTNTQNIGFLGPEEVARISEIITALIQSGALTGVKNGKTIIHFDYEGRFMGVELDYWSWRRPKKEV